MGLKVEEIVLDGFTSDPVSPPDGCYWFRSDTFELKVRMNGISEVFLMQSDITTLAELNAIVGDATLIDTSDSRLSDARTPVAHNHAGADITSGTIDGDRLPAISSSKKGAVPLTGTPSGKFLKDDNTWAVPSGAGVEQDIQQASATNTVNTSSATFVDMPNMTLTTSNTSAKEYIVTFSARTANSGAGNSISVEIMVDGVSQAATIRSVEQKMANSYYNIQTQFKTASLGTGKIIKIRWKCDSATQSVYERNLIIQGIS